MKFNSSILLILASILLLISSTSCIVLYPHKDNGKHKGWYKNSNNPHNPNSTNPGHSGKSKGKGHKK